MLFALQSYIVLPESKQRAMNRTMFKNFKIDKNVPLPAYWQIKEFIKGKIDSGDMSSGDRLPSELELSRNIKVSPMTVRHAFSELVKKGLLERFQGKGTFVSSEKVEAEFEGAVVSSKNIGVLIKDFHGEDFYFQPMISGIEKACAAAGYSLHIHKTGNHGLLDLENSLLRRLIEGGLLQGLLINGALNSGDLKFLSKSGIPHVFLDNEYPGKNYPAVLIDDRAAVKSMLKTLFDNGAKRIGLFCGVRSTKKEAIAKRADRMAQAYHKAMNKNNLYIDDDWIQICVADEASKAVQRILKAKKTPEVIIAYGDSYANIALRAVRELDVQVEVWNYADSENSLLPGVGKPVRQLGECAMELLLSLIKREKLNNVVITLPPADSQSHF